MTVPYYSALSLYSRIVLCYNCCLLFCYSLYSRIVLCYDRPLLLCTVCLFKDEFCHNCSLLLCYALYSRCINMFEFCSSECSFRSNQNNIWMLWMTIQSKISVYCYSLSLISAVLYEISTMSYHVFILCLAELLVNCFAKRIRNNTCGHIVTDQDCIVICMPLRSERATSRLQSSLDSCLNNCVFDFSSVLSSRQMTINTV